MGEDQADSFLEEDFARNWLEFFDGKVRENIDIIKKTREHLREVDKNSAIEKMTSKQYITELSIRDRTLPTDGSEKAIFPVSVLPGIKVENFTGRLDDIERLHKWLGSPDPSTIRKYHIYGRRGIGESHPSAVRARF